MTHCCRHCGSFLEHEVIDLGHQPPSNAYLTPDKLLLPETTYPLKVYICTKCWLVQLPAHAPAEEIFTDDYAYFSSTSSSWCEHAKSFVNDTVNMMGLDEKSHVVEIASNDGYLLQYFKGKGISCLGIEPTHSTAEAARLRGITTLEQFFGLDLAKSLEKADLVVANNVLAHVPDINDFLSGIACILKSNGLASIECPHLLKLLTGNQFDTIYHEHYSYLSLNVIARIADKAQLKVIDVQEISTHGGSLRVWLASKSSSSQPTKDVSAILSAERASGLETLSAWDNFQNAAERSKILLLRFLIDQYESKKVVYGYGAAAKGNTLLNYAGIRSDLLAAVADRAPSKQGKFLPGSHIPVISPETLLKYNPQSLFILPWNLIGEISRQWPGIQLITAIPTLKVSTDQ